MTSKKLNTADKVMLLMTLVPHLLEHGTRSISELADTYAVEPSVMRELVKFLGQAGVPGETGTSQHQDMYDIDWDALEQHDHVLLTNVVAVDDTPRFSTLETATLLAGLHALLPMLTPEMREVAASASRKLAEASTAGSNQAPLTVTADTEHTRLQRIIEAIDRGCDLTFEYRDAAGNHTQRTVRPLSLRQTNEAWYLHAHCHDRGAERMFIVDRMRGESLTAAKNPAAVASSHEPPSLLPVTATICVRSSATHAIASFMPRVIAEIAPGWVRAEVDLRHAGVAVRLVQAAPDSLVVESPREARDAVHLWAARALAQYDG